MGLPVEVLCCSDFARPPRKSRSTIWWLTGEWTTIKTEADAAVQWNELRHQQLAMERPPFNLSQGHELGSWLRKNLLASNRTVGSSVTLLGDKLLSAAAGGEDPVDTFLKVLEDEGSSDIDKFLLDMACALHSMDEGARAKLGEGFLFRCCPFPCAPMEMCVC